MSVHRLNIKFSSYKYAYLKMLYPRKAVFTKDFVVPLVLRAIEEDALLINKAEQRLKKMDPTDLIPIEEAFKEAGWSV